MLSMSAESSLLSTLITSVSASDRGVDEPEEKGICMMDPRIGMVTVLRIDGMGGSRFWMDVGRAENMRDTRSCFSTLRFSS